MSADDRDDVPRCAGVRLSGGQCAARARLGSRFCGRHESQVPPVPLPYLVECVSRRVAVPARVHLHYPGVDRLLCTGSPARGLVPGMGRRTCPRCRALAVEAVARGEVEPDHLRRWNLGEPNINERQS